MFDLSAAFDTVDHSILLRRLEISFGIRGSALKWFSSYLTGRNQQVSVHNVMAMSVFLDYGVPQGSVLGPVLFLLYCTPLILWSWFVVLICWPMPMLMICQFTTLSLGNDIIPVRLSQLFCS